MTQFIWLEPAFQPAADRGWRAYWFRVIFHHHRPDERLFDVLLLVAILCSVMVVILDSVTAIHAQIGRLLYVLEWVFTLLFTAEYLLRLCVVRNSVRYAKSFYGVIDLAAALPTYLSIVFAGAQHLVVIRALRMLRVFRVLEMFEYSREGGFLLSALHRSRRKIGIFLTFVLLITVVFGTVMYTVEGPEHGFTSIPRSMYWAIVTMATVGFGDITPKTPLGQFITSIIVVIGYGVLAVPTGIFGSELLGARKADKRRVDPVADACLRCGTSGPNDARYCHRCGKRLRPQA